MYAHVYMHVILDASYSCNCMHEAVIAVCVCVIAIHSGVYARKPASRM